MAATHNALTDVPGIEVGHAHDEAALTGCTVVLCREGAVAGVDQRGGAPGTRETDLLRPMHMVQEAHAVLLAGGSAYGLDAAAGVMRFLEEQNVGFDVRVGKVPIVPGAILFDLDVGRADVRPDAEMGYRACAAAGSGPVAQGCVGAGMGATVGKLFGVRFATKSGIGAASADLGGGLVVGALVAVNAFGDVVDYGGQIIAGARRPPGGKQFTNIMDTLKSFVGKQIMRFASSTVIGVVATNARFTKEEANKMAQMAQDGLARAIRPAHTMFDGDTLFALATGKVRGDVNLVGAYAAEATERAIRNAVRAARPLGGLPTGAQVVSGAVEGEA
ncbi:MAG: P1 family peptidase [Anaerolineae bacterium]|nr:P1 family peptidase [Anaerolineae bacterium]